MIPQGLRVWDQNGRTQSGVSSLAIEGSRGKITAQNAVWP